MPSTNSIKLLKPSTTVKGGRLVIDRTKSGVPGLDEMMGGGLPKGNLVVLSGDPGSGKTVFCWQFLYEGATKYDEPGVYVSLEETEEAIVTGALEFGMDFREMIENNKLKIITIELYDFERLKSAVEDTIASINAVRVVIDPGVIFRLFFDRELEARKRIVSLGKMLKRIGCTTIITSEITLDNIKGLYGLEEYVADGVILLYHTKLKNKFVRSVGVLKMRNTEISEQLKPLKITNSGIKVLSKAELFEDVKAD
ncbi:MAG: ATPase domain-containing protein [Candidatus Diapherotrites archaeon]|nr:AAA family ATPase [Candidatus Micrarchaeota archaeon]